MTGSESLRATSLRGLRALAVIFDVGEEAEMHGLMTEVLRGEIETKLAAAGLEVFQPGSISEVTGSPVLGVCVRIVRFDGYPQEFAYLISLDLDEWIYLGRRESVRAIASTWHTGLVGTVPGLNLGKLTSPLLQCVDEFISDYQIVNACSV